MRSRTSGSQACESTSFNLAVPMSVYIAATRAPPRSEPQNSHDFLLSTIARSFYPYWAGLRCSLSLVGRRCLNAWRIVPAALSLLSR